MIPELFANPVWHSLRTKHCRFALTTEDACRYPASVAPFAAIGPGAGALSQLATLLVPDDPVWIMLEAPPQSEHLIVEDTIDCFQMVLRSDVEPPPVSNVELVRLSDVDAPEMVALTTLAFPGYFRERTIEMGSYYGVRGADGSLIAMGGERMMFDGYHEISGLCTHPAFRAKGLAGAIVWRLVRDHRQQGVRSWLHVGCANQHAVDIYLRMGFEIVNRVRFYRVSRSL